MGLVVTSRILVFCHVGRWNICIASPLAPGASFAFVFGRVRTHSLAMRSYSKTDGQPRRCSPHPKVKLRISPSNNFPTLAKHTHTHTYNTSGSSSPDRKRTPPATKDPTTKSNTERRVDLVYSAERRGCRPSSHHAVAPAYLPLTRAGGVLQQREPIGSDR